MFSIIDEGKVETLEMEKKKEGNVVRMYINIYIKTLFIHIFFFYFPLKRYG
jgi:hypothetical protein